MNSTTSFETRLASLNGQLSSLRGAPPSAPRTNRVIRPAIKSVIVMTGTDRQFARQVRQLPKMFGLRDLKSTIKLIQRVSGVRLRAEVSPETRAEMIADFSQGKKPREVSEKYGVSIATANVIRKNAGLNKRRVLV